MNLTFLYIGALYAIAIAVEDRRHRLSRPDGRTGDGACPPRVALVFYAIVLVALFRPLTGRFINFAADYVELMPPWSAHSHVTKFNVSNLEIHDATMQLIPWGHQVRELWRSGTVPLWNALNGCGYPLLANGQSSALAPTRILGLPIPSPYWIAGEAAMKLLIALTFTFLYLRRRGSSEIASIAGAISFALSTYVIVWLHFAHATTAVFAPAIFFAIDLIAERRTPQRIAFAAIVAALMVFGGHIETVVYIAVMAVIYVAWMICVAPPPSAASSDASAGEGGGATLAALVIALAAALLLASPFLAPFAEAVTRSLRWIEVKKHVWLGVPFSDPASLVLLLQPRLYGGRPVPWGPASCETITGFAGILGIAGAVAMIASRQWRDRRFAFVIAALIALGIVFDVKFVSTPAHALLPFVALARFRFVLCWCGSVFTAFIVDRLSRPAIVIAAAALVWLFVTRTTPLASLLDAIPSVVVLIVAMIPRAKLLIPIAILVELLAVNRNWNPTFPADKFYPRTPLIEALMKLDDGSRIAGIGEPLYPNTGAIFGFRDVRAHDPMESARYDELLVRTFGYDLNNYYAKWPETPLLDRLNARWIVTKAGTQLPRYRLIYDGDDGRIFENPHAVILSREDGEGPVAHLADGSFVALRRLRMTGSADLLVTSIVSYPGWRSNVGRVVTVDGLWVGVIVPPGTSDVKLRYAPASFWCGVVASILTLLALAGASLRTARLRPDRSTR
jgi:hypothetical protein